MQKRRTLRVAAAITTLSVMSLAVSIIADPAWSQSSGSCKAKNGEVAGVGCEGAGRLTEAEVNRVVEYVLGLVKDGAGGKMQFAPEQIKEATGITVNESNQDQVIPVLMARLQESTQGRAVVAAVQSGASSSSASAATSSGSCSATASASGAGCSVGGQTNRCAEYGACSLTGNLAYAEDDVLKMYTREKAMDGKKFTDRQVPDFEAFDLNGRVVHSTDLVGKPTIVVTLAAHCSHSYDTLPILKQLQESYGDELHVVGVYVNSGSVQDVNSTIKSYAPNFDVWVHTEDSLGDVIESHLVPTYLLVGENGMVQEQLVGFKTAQEIKLRADTLVASGDPTPGNTMGSEE